MSQQALDFGRLYGAEEDYVTSMRSMKDAIDQLSPLVASGAAGVDASDLVKMLSPGSARHFRYRSVFMIGKLAPFETKAAIVAPLLACFGFAAPIAERPLTAEQKLARLEQSVASKFGVMGAQVVEENRR